MNQKNPEDITFQVTVGQLALSSPLPKQNIHVTVCVDNVSKITCAGNLSEDGLTITWNHPFLFSAPPSMTVVVSIYILPEELTFTWDKQPLGDQMTITVAGLLESDNELQYVVPGLPTCFVTLSMTCMVSNVLIAPDGHDCMAVLTEYTLKLSEFSGWLSNVALVSTCIETNLALLDLCLLDHTNHTSILAVLIASFSSRYLQEGSVTDLNRAIEFSQVRLELCPPGHPEHVSALGGLARGLWKHYNLQKDEEDLAKLIEMEERWLELCPSGHPDHGNALSELALSLSERYITQGNIQDLNRAIEMQEKRLDLCPTNDTNYSIALGNLAGYILERYQWQGDLDDLNKAIDLQEKDLELCPSNHQDHACALQNIAVSLNLRYKRMKNHSDLIRTIKSFREALEAYPVQYHNFAFTAAELAHTILQSSDTQESQHEPLPSPDDAFQIYRQLKACGPAVSLDLLNAVQSWVNDAETQSHSSVLEAYQTLLNTLNHFTSLNPALDSQHQQMQTRVADAANNAFSCAIRHGDFQMAVEFLEQGRGILWNQLARFDISLATLESRGNLGRELARKFTRLSADLKKYAQSSHGDDMDPYWRTREGWESVVNNIRRLDGLSRFLLPPDFDDLRRAAERGPVIVVNASKYTCDALIVLHTRLPVHVRLACSLADVAQLCYQLSELTRDAHAYGKHREFYVKEVLRDLWSSVVEPIVSVLQNNIQLPPGSRVWWCPTSKFTSLPFHAAGPHRKNKKNLMDIYVSSYAPSLSALLRARDRLQRSEKCAPDPSGVANKISFAVVGQARPSADIKLGELPEVEHELRRIRDETGMPQTVSFDAVTGAEATIEGAVQAFRDHRWVHVACHGAQHAKKPFDSWFAMRDGKLTLLHIIRERYTNSEFAFLSACHTAVGDESTPDEVLHLAAGMQFAGFNGVIGTLWRVDDAVAHQVVTRLYREMFKQPVLDFEYAATALNTAALETADEVSLEKRMVFVHIGI